MKRTHALHKFREEYEQQRGAFFVRQSDKFLDRLRLRGPNGAQFEFTFAAIAQNLRRLAKLTARAPPGRMSACVS